MKEEPPYDGPFCMVFNASGGWGTTCLMDSKGVNDMNCLYKEGDILTQGAPLGTAFWAGWLRPVETQGGEQPGTVFDCLVSVRPAGRGRVLPNNDVGIATAMPRDRVKSFLK